MRYPILLKFGRLVQYGSSEQQLKIVLINGTPKITASVHEKSSTVVFRFPF